MLRYTSRDDWQLDQRLLAYDLRATTAHVRGLARIGVLSEAERDALVRELEVLAAQNEAGELRLTEDDEDGHSAIEAALVARIGDAGKKVHTGRSRNDQVLVATRLYERDALDELAENATTGARALLDLARREAETPMPGYTHLQRAVPSSVGYWAASFVEGLTDAIDVVRATRALVDRCPLGGAAGFGVNLPLDRVGVARELGFAGVALNPLASQTSRGIIEAQILAAAWQVMAVSRRLAWDLSLFAMSELAFIRLPEAFTTGSSIMPQKRNPDVVELMRAACSVVQGRSPRCSRSWPSRRATTATSSSRRAPRCAGSTRRSRRRASCPGSSRGSRSTGSEWPARSRRSASPRIAPSSSPWRASPSARPTARSRPRSRRCRPATPRRASARACRSELRATSRWTIWPAGSIATRASSACQSSAVGGRAALAPIARNPASPVSRVSDP